MSKLRLHGGEPVREVALSDPNPTVIQLDDRMSRIVAWLVGNRADILGIEFGSVHLDIANGVVCAARATKHYPRMARPPTHGPDTPLSASTRPS